MGAAQTSAQEAKEAPPVAESGLLGELVLDEFYATAKSRTLRTEEEINNLNAINAVRVERAAGKGFIAPLTEAMPKLQMVIAGNGLPRQQHEVDIGIEGLRFVPAHALLPQNGVVTLVNRQEIPIVVGTSIPRLERFQLAPGQRKSLAFDTGEYRVWLENFPYAVLELRVLKEAISINFDWETGAIEATPIPPGEYQLGFYLGARPLHIQPVEVPSEGALQIAATVSANEVVTVSVTTGLIHLEDSPTDSELDGGIPAEGALLPSAPKGDALRPPMPLPKNQILPSQPTTTSP